MVKYTLIGLSTEDVEDTLYDMDGISDADKDKLLDYIKNNEQSFMDELKRYMDKYFTDNAMGHYREDISDVLRYKLQEID